MYHGIQAALRLLYPPRCLSCGILVETDFGLCGPCWRDTPFIGTVVCDACGVPLPGAADGHRLECDACMQSPRLWHRGRAALLYKGVGRKMVLALKHGDRQDIAKPAARWMMQAAQPLLAPGMLVVPVPLHPLRLLRRRYNQSAVLAQAFCALSGHETCPDALIRTRRTRSLDGRSRAARMAELQDAIAAHPRRRQRLRDRPVLLVDDVMTSGATLEACSRACLDAGASAVCVLVLARVANDP